MAENLAEEMTYARFVPHTLDVLLETVSHLDPLDCAVASEQFLLWIQEHHTELGDLRRTSVAKAAKTMKHGELAKELNTRITTVRRLVAEAKEIDTRGGGDVPAT